MFNMNNKRIGRDMIANAERLNQIPWEVYGSRKRHRAIECALNKSSHNRYRAPRTPIDGIMFKRCKKLLWQDTSRDRYNLHEKGRCIQTNVLNDVWHFSPGTTLHPNELWRLRSSVQLHRDTISRYKSRQWRRPRHMVTSEYTNHQHVESRRFWIQSSNSNFKGEILVCVLHVRWW